jgi:RNA polymerase sigma-70 factor (TIGR02960 family)
MREEEFRDLTDPYRRELQVHCYRILGSVQDAEDALQETLVSAWRGLERFEERSSLRTWLYRIATNRCLNMLRDDARRPQGRPQPLPFELPEPTRFEDPPWLEPYPDALLEGLPDGAAGPDARYEAKEAVSLAFVVALQRLPPRQRAVLVLRDVLGFRAAEAARMLDVSEVSVNSALQRARVALEEHAPAPRERARLPEGEQRELAARFADVFVAGDVDGVVALITDEAWLTMPPEPFAYQGPEAIARFLRTAFAARAGLGQRLIPAGANGQPAFVHYVQDPVARVGRSRGLLVLTLEGERVAALTRFPDTGFLRHFGLPRTLPW